MGAILAASSSTQEDVGEDVDPKSPAGLYFFLS